MKRGLQSVLLVKTFIVFAFMGLTSILRGQANGDYRTAATGNWNTVATWQTYDGTTWNAATSVPTGSENLITVQSGHTLTINTAVTISGTLKNQGAAIAFSSGTLTVNGTYEHNTATAVALPAAASTTWGVGSTCKITAALGAATSLSNASQNFYHFIWEPSTQTATMQLSWADGIQIGGDVTINSTGTGSGKTRFTSLSGSTAKTVNIAGNVNINLTTGVSVLESTGSSATGLLTINVGGNVSVAGGSLFLVASSAPWIWKVSGNFSMTSGTVSKGSGVGSFNFVGSGNHIFSRALAAGTFASSPAFVLEGTGKLSMGTSVFDGGGTFTVNDGATFESGSPSGISGNIQTTGTKTFGTNANYSFNGSSAQVTSSLLPATVNNLTINNAAGVSLSASTTVTGTLNLISGSFTLNTSTLTMGSSSQVKGTGTIVGNYSHPAGATLSPGFSPGTTTISGNLTNLGNWAIELSGTTAGTQYDQVLVTGSATLTSGTIDVTLINSYDPAIGATFIILDAASLSGTFTAINLPALSSGKAWATPVYDNTSGTVTLMVNAALSTELVSFTAKAQPHGNLIEWTTATEQNNASFDIERSTNGRDFVSLGQVKGNGTTNNVSTYTFTDETPLSISYYRLRSVDFNGKSELSNVVTVVRSNKSSIKVYPTVATDKLFVIASDSENRTFSIVNLLGVVVQQGVLTEQKELTIGQLAMGTYWLKVGNEIIKFVKH